MKRVLTLCVSAAMLMALCVGCGEDASSTDTSTSIENTATYEYITRDLPAPVYRQAATAFAGGTGSENDPYQIADAAQLMLMSNKIGEDDDAYTTAHYVLTADIVLNDTLNAEIWDETPPTYSWKPIDGLEQGGSFDGNGYTIRGMYINTNCEEMFGTYGLFGMCCGTVRNVTVENSYIAVSGKTASVGGIVGELCYGEKDGTVDNCSSAVIIDAYEGEVGGVVGSGGNVKNTHFAGVVRQEVDRLCNIGGIVGSGGNIDTCINYGSVQGNDYVGGISGWSTQVTNCSNKGDVCGLVVGGIVGNMYKTGTGLEQTITQIAVQNCVNEGTVTTIDSDSAIAGGIIGKAGNDEEDVTMHITDCVNRGQVQCKQIVAGVIGRLSVERASTIAVERCVNDADITDCNKIGGVIGELMGAILNQRGDVSITACQNRGVLGGEGDYRGGIIAYFMVMGEKTDLRLTVEDCANSGNVSSQQSAGGVLGFCSSELMVDLDITKESAILFRGCSNSATVIGKSSNTFVGGIAGNVSMAGIPTTFENCTNSGDVRLEFTVSEESLKYATENDFEMKFSQIVGGIVGRLGEGTLLTTDNDEGNAKYVNSKDPCIMFNGCANTGALSTSDYSQYLSADGRQIWKNYVGGIIGQTCAEKGYAFFAENCTYSGVERGLGNDEYPDIG